jgi:chromate transporter
VPPEARADPLSTLRPHQEAFASEAATLGQLALLFAKLGVVAFGGPVAHIAMMEREVVERRRWIDRRHFLDLIAATNLLPGPNSTQMTMHVGYVQRGDRGVLVAGTAFIAPAALLTLIVSWAWVTFRELPVMQAALIGIRPVVLAVIVAAMLRLAPRAADDLPTRVVLVAALGLALLGVEELVIIALGALAGLGMQRRWRTWWHWRSGMPQGAGLVALVALAGPLLTDVAVSGSQGAATALTQLWWLFLRFGLTLFGSGYLLVAYLQGGLVEGAGLLSSAELLDAIVIGEMTPGPLFTVSTAVGYLLEGVPGALIATIAIFLPSFPLAMLLGRIMPRVSRSDTARSVIRGLGAAVVGLMLAVAWDLGRRTLEEWPSLIVATVALGLLLRTRVSPVVLIPLGALAGVALSLLAS